MMSRAGPIYNVREKGRRIGRLKYRAARERPSPRRNPENATASVDPPKPVSATCYVGEAVEVATPGFSILQIQRLLSSTAVVFNDRIASVITNLL